MPKINRNLLWQLRKIEKSNIFLKGVKFLKYSPIYLTSKANKSLPNNFFQIKSFARRRYGRYWR